MKAIPSVSLDSDHRMVSAKIKIQKPKRRAKKIKRLTVENLKADQSNERLRENNEESANKRKLRRHGRRLEIIQRNCT